MTRIYPIGEEMQMIFDQAQILATYRARKALAEKHTPGGKLTKTDMLGIVRTVANIHKVDAPTVLALVLEDGQE